MPCSEYLPNPMVHPGYQVEINVSKKQQFPRPSAWSKHLRSQSSHVSLRKSKSTHREPKSSKKDLASSQKVEIVKSIWQVNMPLLHSNAPEDMNPDPSQRLKLRAQFSPRFEEKPSQAMGPSRPPKRSESCREISSVENGQYYHGLAITTADFPVPPSANSRGDGLRRWPERKVSKIRAADFQYSNIHTESSSPSSEGQISPLAPERTAASPLKAASIMSPLPREPSLKYRAPGHDHLPSQDNARSPSHQGSPFESISTPAGLAGGLASSAKNPSRSSLEWFPDAVSPIQNTTDNSASPTNGYDLISPISAGVFDNSPRLRRNPTFIKQRSLTESKMKPLPPAPNMPVAPLVVRRATVVARTETTTQSPRTEEPVSLPQKPKAADLDSLDEAFRRSGLLETPSGGSHSPSLREATEQLEKQLTRMSTDSLSGTLLPSPRLPCPSGEASRDTDPCIETLIPADDMHAKSAHPVKGESTNTAVNERASYMGAKDFALRRSITLSAQNLRDAQLNVQQLKHHHSCDSIAEVTRTVNSHGRSISLEPPTSVSRGPSRAALFLKREVYTENRVRMRLPRIRTAELVAGLNREPVNLSIVVESPERESFRVESMNAQILSSLSENVHPSGSPAENADQPQNLTPTPEEELVKLSNTAKRTILFPKLLDIYTASCTPRRTSQSDDSAVPDIAAAAAGNVVHKILQSVDSLEDLFNLAALNKAFYTVFKKNELPLIKGTLFRMSPAAWELREMSTPWEDDDYDVGIVDRPVPEYTPNLYIRHYMRDLCTMVSLKWLILVRCESLLRPETIRALAGQDEERSAEVDDAFWRVWTFCRLFGCGKGREEDISAQADWLSGGSRAQSNNRDSSGVLTCPTTVDSVLFDPPEGFARGNEGGLTATQLYDMMEIWTCLGVLVQVFYGKTTEAREYGVFDGEDLRPGDVVAEDALLESWTQYLLTLGPSAILTLSSLNSETPIETMFARAKSLGWTKWTSPTKARSGSNRSFLKEAVSRVYDNQLVRGDESPRFQTPKLQQSRSPNTSRPASPQRRPRSLSVGASISRQRRKEFASQLRRKRQEVQERANMLPNPDPNAEERPISNFQEIIQRLDGDGSTPSKPLSHSRANTPRPSRSTKKSVSPSPPIVITTTPPPPATPVVEVEEKISQGRHPSPPAYTSRRRSRTPAPIFIDPADKALHKLVYELGFNESDAKWALKCTDTGESLDVEAAIELLLPKIGGYGAKGVTAPCGGRECVPGRHSPLMCPKFDTAAFEKKVGVKGNTDLLHRPTWRWA